MSAIGFDVRYHGIELDTQVVLSRVGPTVAFVGLESPAPVGASLDLVHGETAVPATVIRTVESLKGRQQAAGNWVRVELDDASRELWQPLVEGDDVVIPEPVGAAAVAAPEKVDRLRSTPEADDGAEPDKGTAGDSDQSTAGDSDQSAAGEITASDQPASDTDDDMPAAGSSSAETPDVQAQGEDGARVPKKTQVMSAIDIREALGQEPVEEGSPEGEADAGVTQPMGSGAAGGKKKKKRKRRKKR